MTQYYADIIRWTRTSARSLARVQKLARQIRATDDIDLRARLFVQHDRALMSYHKAQAELARRPLSAADIAARQADYPKAKE